MRALLLLAALTATAPFGLKAQWTIQTPTTADLRGIDNVGKGVAWASGTNGTVLRTEDAGYLWQTCTIPPGAEHLDFRGIQAFDANTAIVMSSGTGDQSRLYKTTDGCQTWKLILTNPDKNGFWDAIRFDRLPVVMQNRYGFLIGDPVDGKFVIYETNDSGSTWSQWLNDRSARPAVANKNESLFAASNSALISPGINGYFAFVTGGISGSHLLFAQEHSPFDTKVWTAFSKIKLPFAKSESSGAFSMAAHLRVGLFQDLVIVGGDYKQPDKRDNTACFIPAFTNEAIKATTPPHGFRSAVAYDAPTKTWITVGPNGTDISTDDGRNWRALHPAANEAPDADQHWNALSLPYAIGPHGRIGILNPDALRPTTK